MREIFLYFTLSILLGLPSDHLEKKQPPNVLIILADDLGYGDLGCYGNTIIQTPNLDKLAAEGLLLTDCYASAPMCSPSRAGLLTGRVPYRTGIYDWIAPDSLMHLPQNEMTIATLLQKKGYATSLFGKWHLNGTFNSQEQTQPDDHGFEYWMATQYSSRHKNPEGFYRNGKPMDEQEGYSCHIVASEAVNWLKKNRDKKKPFFQLVAFHEPHEPIMSPPGIVEQYSDHGKKAEYYANVSNLDAAIGFLLNSLRKAGLMENTLIIFTSDNGPAEYTPKGYFNKSHGSAGPLRGFKRHQFEGGLRVPGIIHWPARIKPGSRNHTPVSNVDLLPTISQLTDISLPSGLKLDGSDISPLFEGKKIDRHTPLHWHFYDPWGGPQSVLRAGDYILGAAWDVGDFHKSGRFDPSIELPIIKSSGLSNFSLYNIRKDVHQDHDIADEHPELVQRLSDQLIQLHQEVIREAPFPKAIKAKTEQPNILLIVSEDNGPDLACYGVPEVNSPNIDRLAAQGALFENAFVTYSVCSPSRSTIFTGLYPHQNGQIGLATHRYRMYDDIVETLPVLLKKAGYRTGCLGKIHVNPESAIPFDFHPIKGANFAKKDLPRYAREGAAFMRASAEPFFLMVNYPDAHFPLQEQVEGMPAHPLAPQDIKSALPFVGADSDRLRQFTANYYNSMMRLDEAVGMLIDSVETSGKARQTFIIYLGDHGAQFSRGKCSNYEAGLRIPFILKWPGRIQAGQRKDQLISTIDLLPTLLDAANLAPPPGLPGGTLLPLVSGTDSNWERQYIFAGGAGSAAFFFYPRRSVRDERYKLIFNLLPERENPKFEAYARQVNQHFAAGTTIEEIAASSEIVQTAYQRWKMPPPFELYDLRNDPFEWRDLSENPAYKAIFSRLKEALEVWQQETKDPFRDNIILQEFTAEIDTVLARYPNRDYHRNPDFQWKYPDYFRSANNIKTDEK